MYYCTVCACTVCIVCTLRARVCVSLILSLSRHVSPFQRSRALSHRTHAFGWVGIHLDEQLFQDAITPFHRCVNLFVPKWASKDDYHSALSGEIGLGAVTARAHGNAGLRMHAVSAYVPAVYLFMVLSP